MALFHTAQSEDRFLKAFENLVVALTMMTARPALPHLVPMEYAHRPAGTGDYFRPQNNTTPYLPT
jgi:hypothetical protein